MDKGGIPVIIDTGAYSCKAGLAKENNFIPTIKERTIVGYPKHYDETDTGNLYVGNETLENGRNLNLLYPFECGNIIFWDEIEKVWHQVYKSLKISYEEHPLLCTVPYLQKKICGEILPEIFFEKFKVPSLCIKTQEEAALAINKIGLPAILVNSGEHISTIVPFKNNLIIDKEIVALEIAGRDINHYMQEFLMKKGYNLTEEVARVIKENVCNISPYFKKELKSYHNNYRPWIFKHNAKKYIIDVERIVCPEILFKPALGGYKNPGLIKVVNDMSTRILNSEMLMIILAGGSSEIKGFKERFQKKFEGMFINSGAYIAFEGANILALQSNFTDHCITRYGYEELGIHYFA